MSYALDALHHTWKLEHECSLNLEICRIHAFRSVHRLQGSYNKENIEFQTILIIFCKQLKIIKIQYFNCVIQYIGLIIIESIFL